VICVKNIISVLKHLPAINEDSDSAKDLKMENKVNSQAEFINFNFQSYEITNINYTRYAILVTKIKNLNLSVLLYFFKQWF